MPLIHAPQPTQQRPPTQVETAPSALSFLSNAFVQDSLAAFGLGRAPAEETSAPRSRSDEPSRSGRDGAQGAATTRDATETAPGGVPDWLSGGALGATARMLGFGPALGSGGSDAAPAKVSEADPKKVTELVDGLIASEGIVDTSEDEVLRQLRALRGNPALLAAVRERFATQKGMSLDDWVGTKFGMLDTGAAAAEADALLTGDRIAATVAVLAPFQADVLGASDAQRDAAARALGELSPSERLAVQRDFSARTGTTLASVLGAAFGGDDEDMMVELAGNEAGTIDYARVAALAIDQRMDNVIDDDEDGAYAAAEEWLDLAWDAEKRSRGPLQDEAAEKQKFAEGFRDRVATAYEDEFTFAGGLLDQFGEESAFSPLPDVEREKMWYVLGGNTLGEQASDLELATRGAGTKDKVFWDTMVGEEANPLAAARWWEQKYARGDEKGGNLLTDEFDSAAPYAGRFEKLLDAYRQPGLSKDRQAALEEEAKLVMASMAIDEAFGGEDDGTGEELARQALAGLTKEQIERVALLQGDGNVDFAKATPEQRAAAVQRLRGRASGEMGGDDGVRFDADAAYGSETASVQAAKEKEAAIHQGIGGGGIVDWLASIGADGNTPHERLDAIHTQATALKPGDEERAEALLTHQGAAIDHAKAQEDTAVDALSTAAALAATGYLAPLLATEGLWLDVAKAVTGGLGDAAGKVFGGLALSDGSQLETEDVVESGTSVVLDGLTATDRFTSWFGEGVFGEGVKGLLGKASGEVAKGGEEPTDWAGVFLDPVAAGGGAFLDSKGLGPLGAMATGMATDGVSGAVSGFGAWWADEEVESAVAAKKAPVAAR